MGLQFALFCFILLFLYGFFQLTDFFLINNNTIYLKVSLRPIFMNPFIVLISIGHWRCHCVDFHWLLKQPLEVFCKKGVLGNFTKLTMKTLCQSLFFDNFVLKRKQESSCIRVLCFPVKLAKFLRTYFLQNTSGRLPLQIYRFRDGAINDFQYFTSSF